MFGRPLWDMEAADADAYFGTVLRAVPPNTGWREHRRSRPTSSSWSCDTRSRSTTCVWPSPGPSRARVAGPPASPPRATSTAGRCVPPTWAPTRSTTRPAAAAAAGARSAPHRGRAALPGLPALEDPHLRHLRQAGPVRDLPRHRQAVVSGLQTALGPLRGRRSGRADLRRKQPRAALLDLHPPRPRVSAHLPGLRAAGPHPHRPVRPLHTAPAST
jgi:hypothetical protein